MSFGKVEDFTGGFQSGTHRVIEALENEPDADVRVGDAVYGLTSFCRNGTDAEYVAVRAADLAPKPKTLDHTQAAAVPLSALTAW